MRASVVRTLAVPGQPPRVALRLGDVSRLASAADADAIQRCFRGHRAIILPKADSRFKDREIGEDVSPVSEVLDDMAPRLRAAQRNVDDTRVAARLAVDARNELVVRAADEGMSNKAIAAALGVGQPHVGRILLAAEPQDLIPR